MSISLKSRDWFENDENGLDFFYSCKIIVTIANDKYIK